RTKTRKEFKVPLSEAACEVIRGLERHRRKSDDLIFPGIKPGKPISHMAMLNVLKRMGVKATAHGFRSALMDWAHETTSFPKVAIDMALGHKVSDAVEAAYRRGDLFIKRAALMDSWATFCASKPAKVLAHPASVAVEGRG